jgi:hypothetical protein
VRMIDDHDDERGPWCEDPEHCAAEARATVDRAAAAVRARRKARLRVLDGGLTASGSRPT